MRKSEVRKGQPSVQLTRQQFDQRYRTRFYDPAFESVEPQLVKILGTAWQGYNEYRKSPRTRKVGSGFADPNFAAPVEWLETRRKIRAAERRQRRRRTPRRILLICGSARSDQTCPGEMSKTYRLVKMARSIFQRERGFELDLLDLSHLTSEYGRVIYPCKACVSTAMPLCHWPCSCYPNHAMGQVTDWMAEIYERWAAAHGVMIVTPVYWYQAPSVLKLMIDRLVCADGGNPDLSSTSGKNPAKAKALELKGWDYPRHLAGRAFSVLVHGDAEGVGALRHALTSWLQDMKLVPAGNSAQLGRYIGYYQPYATSHDALDKDEVLHEEVRNAARSLIETVKLIRAGKYRKPDEDLQDPRPK